MSGNLRIVPIISPLWGQIFGYGAISENLPNKHTLHKKTIEIMDSSLCTHNRMYVTSISNVHVFQISLHNVIWCNVQTNEFDLMAIMYI